MVLIADVADFLDSCCILLDLAENFIPEIFSHPQVILDLVSLQPELVEEGASIGHLSVGLNLDLLDPLDQFLVIFFYYVYNDGLFLH